MVGNFSTGSLDNFAGAYGFCDFGDIEAAACRRKQEFAENVSDEVLTDTDSERVVDYRQGGNRKAGLRPSGQVV